MHKLRFIIGFIFFITSSTFAEISTGQVQKLLSQAVSALEANASQTLSEITEGKAPYKNSENPALYAFVYTPDVRIVAHPNKHLVGKSYKGKPDVRGNKFRDKIVANALAKKTEPVVYYYKKPESRGIFKKQTFYRLVKGSDNKKYIVCVGRYIK